LNNPYGAKIKGAGKTYKAADGKEYDVDVNMLAQ
jgi:hypothetical protein